MKNNCIFCSIAADSTKLIWANEGYAAFKDIHPKARIHILIVPKKHVNSFDDLPGQDAKGLVKAIQTVAREQNVAGAYRIQVNVGREGGQEVDHFHVHVLAK